MNYQIGKQKITEDKLRKMSGNDANALYYATHQGNKQANTMFTNPGSYVDTGEQEKGTKEDYENVLRQIKQIHKNINEPKREIPKLEKPVKSEQKEQKAEKNPDLLDYYTHKDLIEESTNIRNRGMQNRGLSDLDQKRLREIDTALEKNDKALKASKTDNYLVHRDRYDDLMKDGQMQKDIDALAMAYSNSQGTRGRGVRALQAMGYRNSKEYAESLAKKYGLTKEQIDDIVKTYTSDKYNEQNQKIAENTEKFAEKHPILGSVGSSLLGTTGSAVEGAYNTLAGLTNDDRNISRTFNAFKGGLRQGVTNDIDSNVGKTAYNLAMGLGDLGIGVASGNAPLLLAGNTANDAFLTSVDNGADLRNASAYALGAGITDYLFNKIGLDKAKSLAVENLKATGLKRALAQNAIAGAGEAGENVLQDVAQSLLDQLINGENSELQTSFADKIADGKSEDEAFAEVAKEYGAQVAMSAGTGYLMGSAMQGVPTLVNNFKAGLANQDLAKNRNNVWNKVEGFEQSKITDEDVNNPVDNYTPEQRAVVDGYKNAGDSRIGKWIDNVRNGRKAMEYLQVAQENDAVADYVQNQTGIDIHDNEIGFSKSFLNHDTNEHMSDKGKSPMTDKDLEKIAFVLENPDDVAISPKTSRATRTKDNRRAPVIVMRKRIDGHYYVVETITDAKTKRDVVTSAFIEKVGNETQEYKDLFNSSSVYHVANAFDDSNPLPNAQDVHENNAVDSLSNETISQNEDVVNSQPTEENAKVPEEIPEENAETPETTDIPEETRNRLKMNLQFFAELMDEKERLQSKLTEKGVKLSERRAINDRIANIDEQLTNFRKTITNTAVKAGIVTMEDIENDPELSKIVNYVVHHNADIVERARQNLSENSEQIKNEYVSGKTEIKTDQDADQAMMLLKGEYGELSNYERNAILKNLAEHGTEAGQFIQSLSKYSNTKEGALISAAKVMSDEVKYWASRNKRAVGINGKLATALKMQGYDGTMDLTKPKPTFDELRQQIRNTLAEEYSSIENQFTDSDVDYLAHMIEHNATIEDLTEALNTKMATGKFGISDETQAEINRLFDYAKQFDEDSMEYVEAQAEAFRLLAEEVAPRATPLEKFDAWRYIAMLGNPKTMLRNFIGNKMFSAITGVSNNLAVILEAGADATVKGGKLVSNKILGTDFDTSKGIQRTKTAINPISDRALLKATKADAYNKKGRQIEGSKYEKMDKDTLRKNRSVFDSDVMKLVEKAVDRGISDTKAVVSKYSTSMAGYMKANGLTEADIQDSYRFDELKRKNQYNLLSKEESAEMESLRPKANEVEKAREYALKQAEYATFHEDSKIADALGKLSRDSMGTKVAMEGLVPFKKTPINIIRSGVEYSPFGALKSIAKTGKLIYENVGKNRTDLPDTYQVRNPLTHGYKDVNRTLAADVIDSWSKTLTGSGLVALGYYLFNKGILHSSTKDEKYQDDLEGKQNYSIEINGKTYTIDWAVPAAMPILLGAEIKKAIDANAISDEKWYNNLDAMLGTLDGLLEPVIETSMLQGVQNTVDTFSDKYGDSGAVQKLANAGTTLGVNYLSQAIPTLSGQISRTIDNTRRSTDTVNTGLLGNLEKQGRKVMNKTPLSRLNNPYVDARGEQAQNAPYNGIGRLGYQMFSPWYAQDIDTRPSDEIARDTYNGLDKSGNPIKDADVFADWKSTVKINGQKLDPDQMYDYRTAAGKVNTEVREALAKESWFKNAPAETQTEILKNTNTLADHVGKAKVKADYSTDSDVYEAYEKGGVNGVLDYYKTKAHKSDVKDELGTSSDWVMDVYDKGGKEKYKKALDVAKNYGYDALTKEEYQIYDKKGGVALSDHLKSKKEAEYYGVPNSKEFKKALSNGTAKTYAQTYKAVTSTKTGEDDLGNDTFLDYSDKTAQIYKDLGQVGLNNYAKLKSNLGDSDKDTDFIKAMDEARLSKKDKAYYFVLHKGDSIAKSAPKDTKEHTYMWYLAKQKFDANNNGTLDKSEKATLSREVVPYLKSIGYTDANVATTWTFK